MKEKFTRTKIVCTIGPASRSREILAKMIEAGMDVARLNLSHDTHSAHRKTFDTIRSIDPAISIMFDIQGPKIRIGELKEPLNLETGAQFVISTKDFVGDSSRVSISYKELPDDIKPGDMIAINDGIVRLCVTGVNGTEVETEVANGGPISSRKGVNIPGIELSSRVPTEKDLKDLDLAAELEPDLIAISFVIDAEDVKRVNELLKANGPKNVDVISKIEHLSAVKNYDAILEESHGVMVARGDLGIEVPIEEVPILQRDLVRKANMWARASIVATQMLESMTYESIPTRAEVSDVAHAVFDRTDAVMLSGESAVGHDPVAAVSMMNKIVRRAELRITPVNPEDITSPKRLIVEIIGNLVYNSIALIPDKVDGIVTATRSGFTARWISKFRPPANIYAVTRDPTVMRRMRLWWGVQPILYEQEADSVDDLVMETVRAVHAKGLIDEDMDVVFTSGVKHIPGRTNVVGLFHVGDLVHQPRAQY